MGYDSYSIISITAAAIPLPKESLQHTFNLQGFKLMTVVHDTYDIMLDEDRDEYHGAMICLADTELPSASVDVQGPNEIRDHEVTCMRMKHLDAFMPADIRDRLVRAFETYTGRKPDVVPGFWTVTATASHLVRLHTTWALGEEESIDEGNCDSLNFSVQRDA